MINTKYKHKMIEKKCFGTKKPRNINKQANLAICKKKYYELNKI